MSATTDPAYTTAPEAGVGRSEAEGESLDPSDTLHDADDACNGHASRKVNAQIASVLDGAATWHVEHGDNRVVLATMPDACIDAIVCDPPYELGFMGRAWDASGIAYSVDLWREVLRVLKPGGHLLAFGGTRTYHRMTCAIEDAGFEVRDCLTWLYGSGFPKSLDVSKAIDKAAGAAREVVGTKAVTRDLTRDGRTGDEAISPVAVRGTVLDITAPATDAARQWSGWGTALKPASEPIVLARKPLAGTVAANVLAHGTGALNVDGCRVAHNEECRVLGEQATPGAFYRQAGRRADVMELKPSGRWPANIVLTHADECVQVGTRQVERRLLDATANTITGDGRFGTMGGSKSVGSTSETVEVWNCVEDCPVRMLDEQSGKTTSRQAPRGSAMGYDGDGATRQHNHVDTVGRGHNDAGGASRFFYTAKASTSEREKGLDHRKRRKVTDGREASADNPRLRGETQRANIHPTVKPVDLMRWLCRLVTPPGGVVLDPFAGSGSTVIAALAEGFRAVGIELDEEHVDIARDRIVGDNPLFNSAMGVK